MRIKHVGALQSEGKLDSRSAVDPSFGRQPPPDKGAMRDERIANDMPHLSFRGNSTGTFAGHNSFGRRAAAQGTAIRRLSRCFH